MNLSKKLILAAIFFSIVPVMITSIINSKLAVDQSHDALEEVAKQRLVALRDVRKTQLERYLDTIRNQVQNLSAANMVVEAMDAFMRTAANYDIEAPDSELEQWRSRSCNKASRRSTLPWNR